MSAAKPLPEPPDHASRMAVARRVALWHIGDPSWADMIVQAYTDPAAAAVALEEEKRD